MSVAAEPRGHVRTALVAGAVALGMVGLAYASAPLYRIFCQVTGFGGTTQRVESIAATPITDRTVKVRFDGNVRGGLPWRFAPAQGPMEIRIGEQNMAFFKAGSSFGKASTGSATFNVTPAAAGKYFAKIQCFCFQEQTLAPGQTVEMPVVFYVDPAILDDPDARDIDEITLSYSFFPVAEPTRPAGIYATGQAAIPHRGR
jgi:cytochrome c oxidase assembly protein subunit 11